MRNVAIHAAFVSGVFAVRLPAPNKDARRWHYWIHVSQNYAGDWVARVRHQITGMDSPADVGEFPVSEISDSFAMSLARQIAADTPMPPVTRKGRQHPEDCQLNESVWVVTLQGVDKAGNARTTDVVVTRGPMQDGLNLRREPCTAKVRRRTAPENANWYLVPCNGMGPQDAGDAAVAACKWIRWD